MRLCYGRSQRILHKSRSHLQILGTRSKFHTEDSQFRNDLWTSLFSGTFCSVHVNWYTLYTLVDRQQWLGRKYRRRSTKSNRMGDETTGIFLHSCPTGNKLERANHSRASQKHITLWLRFGYIQLSCIINIRGKKNQRSKPIQSTYFLHKSDKKRNEQDRQLHSGGYSLTL